MDEIDLQNNIYLAVKKFTDAAAAQTFIAISLDKLEQVVICVLLWIIACLLAFPERQGDRGRSKEPVMPISYWSPRLAGPPYGIQQKRPNL